ncbi:MAG: hypothetical protein ACI957_000923, partial [Verrucomicrobiales bacterium]
MLKHLLVLLTMSTSLGEGPITVIVPYDSDRSIAEQADAPVFLSDEALQALAPEEIHPPARWTHATLDMEVGDGLVRGTYSAKMHTPAPGELVLKRPKGSSEILLDGEPVIMSKDHVHVPTPGVHEIQFSFIQAAGLEIPVPMAATAIARIVDGDTTWTSSFAGKESFKIERPRVPAPIDNDRDLPSLEWTHHLFIAPQSERLETEAQLHFPGDHRSQIMLTVDSGWTLTDIQAGPSTRWSIQADRIVLEFDPPVADKIDLRLHARRAISEGLDERLTPKFGVSSQRERTHVIFAHTSDVDLAWTMAPPWSPHAPAQDTVKPPCLFAGGVVTEERSATLAYTVRAKASPSSLHFDHCYTYHPDHVDILTLGHWENPSNVRTLSLPFEGSTPQAVTGDQLRDWARTDDRIILQFDASKATTSFKIRWRQDRIDQSVPWIQGDTNTVTLVSTHDLEVQISGETDSLPMESLPWQIPKVYHTHAYFEASSSPLVTAAHVAMPYDISQRIDAEVGFDQLIARAELTFPRTSQIRIIASPEVLALEATGPSVIHVASSAHPDGRQYLITLSLEIEKPSVLLQSTITRTNASHFLLPAWSFPDAREVLSELAFTHSKDLRIETDSQPPYRLRNAETHLQITPLRLAPYDQRPARLRLADLSSILYPSGDVWHEANYHIKNRSLQHLTLRPIPGYTIRTAHVNGVSVPLYQSPEDDLLRISLTDQSLPTGATEVKLLAHQAKAIAADDSRARLNTFDLVDLVPERTLWHVSIPSDWDIKDVQGNLQPSHRDDQIDELIRRHFDVLEEISQLLPTLAEEQRHLALTEFQEHENAIDVELLNVADPEPWKLRLGSLKQTLSAESNRSPSLPAAVHRASPLTESEVTVRPGYTRSVDADLGSRRAQATFFSLPSPNWSNIVWALPTQRSATSIARRATEASPSQMPPDSEEPTDSPQKSTPV